MTDLSQPAPATSNQKIGSTEGGPRQAPAPPLPNHPIAAALRRFLHRIRDIEVAARVYVPLSVERRRKRFDDLKTQIDRAKALSDSSDPAVKAHAIREANSLIRNLERLLNSSVPSAIQNSLFLGLFSSYDAYSGDLLSAVYQTRPELYRKLKRSIEVGKLLQYNTFDELKTEILSEEIESFRRKSYVDQFADLEEAFDLTLTKFDNWPQFVECGQRRNLITHCDGIVSSQYLSICRKHGASLPADLDVGHKLRLSPKYFLTSCDLHIEVGTKLAHTLWRKVAPEELADADRDLQEVAFEFLQGEQWSRAAMLAEFAAGQKSVSKDLHRRIAIVNWAIALKHSGHEQKALSLLARHDWSASLPEFRLAAAVLRDEFAEAAEIMRRIGTAGELVEESSYHIWPLFRTFRGTAPFLDAYQAVYGRPFVDKLSEDIEAAVAVAPSTSAETTDGASEDAPASSHSVIALIAPPTAIDGSATAV